MSDLQKLDFETNPHHAISRGNNKATVFHAEADFLTYLNIVSKCKEKLPFLLYHYILMDNHVHLSLSPGPKGNLGDIMKYINYTYSMKYRAKHDTVGHLWKNRFKRYSITNDSYMQTSGIYIELNPVRAGMVSAPEDYRWSSYRMYAFGEPNPLLDPDPTYLALGNNDHDRQVSYKALTDMWLNNDVDKKTARNFFKTQAGAIHPSLKK